MIYITGDTHAEFKRFSKKVFDATENDYVIICGDFGGVWDQSAEQKYWLDWLAAKPWTTLFLDGNHENYDLLATYPVNQWHGGKVHFIRPNVIHLMRGQVFVIDGIRFFVMGGASSHDISSGILELDDPDFYMKRRRLDRARALYRINHLSWWKEELPSEEEYAEGLKNLEAVGNRVDVILSHCAPSSIQDIISGGFYQKDRLTDYLDQVREQCSFRRWFFGHYHENRGVGEQFTLLLMDRLMTIILAMIIHLLCCIPNMMNKFQLTPSRMSKRASTIMTPFFGHITTTPKLQ